MEMGERFVENDFFKDFGQKWKVRNGTVVFQKIFIKRWIFQQRFDDSSLQITLYNASGKRCVDDVRDGGHNLCIPNNIFTSVLTKAEVIPLLKTKKQSTLI